MGVPGDKKTAKIGQGKAGPGRPKGMLNKSTALLKDAILEAATQAGGEGGLVAYLKMQAHTSPGPFMSLLGKVLPTQLTGDKDNPVHHKIESDAKFQEVVGLLDAVTDAATGSDSGAGEVAETIPPSPKDA